MYDQTRSCVKVNNCLSRYFSINVGTRQGCNLSPNLFNLFLSDLPKTLKQPGTEAVQLDNEYINLLMYVDDIVLLSHTSSGLKKLLGLLHEYCEKWGLRVNTNKTKVIIFNTRKSPKNLSFEMGQEGVEIVNEYNYLGIIFRNNGNFKTAKQELKRKAQKALFSILQTFSDEDNVNVTLLCKLYDIYCKPILLYSAEVLGGFDWKIPRDGLVLNKVFLDNKSEWESLQNRLCKRLLGVNRYCSNIMAKAELGIDFLCG